VAHGASSSGGVIFTVFAFPLREMTIIVIIKIAATTIPNAIPIQASNGKEISDLSSLLFGESTSVEVLDPNSRSFLKALVLFPSVVDTVIDTIDIKEDECVVANFDSNSNVGVAFVVVGFVVVVVVFEVVVDVKLVGLVSIKIAVGVKLVESFVDDIVDIDAVKSVFDVVAADVLVDVEVVEIVVDVVAPNVLVDVEMVGLIVDVIVEDFSVDVEENGLVVVDVSVGVNVVDLVVIDVSVDVKLVVLGVVSEHIVLLGLYSGHSAITRKS